MRVRFGECELDTDRAELRRSGELVDVQPLVFSVIEMLVRHRERVVSKEELLDELWGDRFVGESTLATRVKFARRAVGDDGASQSIIRTVHGRGYRFVADVEAIDDDGRPPANTAGAATLAVPATSRPSTERPARGPEGRWPFTGRRDEFGAVVAAAESRTVGGVLVEGPTGVGTTRFAEECVNRLASQDQPVWRVRGFPDRTDIPLAALTDLLPADVVAPTHQADDLARAEMFRRARDALDRLRDGRRVVLLVDDAPRVDPLSTAVLASLVTAQAVFAVVTGRSGTGADDDSDFDGLARSGVLHTIELGPLDDIDIDVLLYRALRGPIDDDSVALLVQASRGRPAALRDIVDTSRRSGALVREDGVWRLAERPVSSWSTEWPPERLSSDARNVAARMALLGPTPLSLLTDLVSDDGLHDLDDAGFVLLDGEAGDPQVGLTDALLETAVIEGTGRLRLRSLVNELTESLLERPLTPWALARIVSWDVHTDRVDARTLLDHALLSLVSGDFADAQTLAEAVDLDEQPGAAVVRAELALRRNQWQQADRLLREIDVDRLEPVAASLALRRRWTIEFTYRNRHTDALDALAEGGSRPGPIGHALAARRLGLLATSGRYGELERAAQPLLDTAGVSRVEVLGAVAVALLGTGRIAEASELTDEALSLVRTIVPSPWRPESLDALFTTKVGTMLQEGDLAGASSLVRTHLPSGRRSRLGLLPVIGAEIELEAARPRVARELIRAVVASSRRDEFPHYLGLAEVILCRCDLARGTGSPEAGIDAGLSALPSTIGVARWRLGTGLAELLAAIGRRDEVVPLLSPLADEAREGGARIAEADLLFASAVFGPLRAVDPAIAERLTETARPIEGRLWPLRRRHVEALASGGSLDGLAEAYADLGYLRYASLIESPESAAAG
ncbi:MAG: winged helix-turn-helix domain-containing protein [Actinomycetota bacterium]